MNRTADHNTPNVAPASAQDSPRSGAPIFESEIFLLTRGKMLGSLRSRYARKSFMAGGALLVVLIALGVIFRDPRIPVAGALFLMLGWTVLTSFLYINYAITKSMIVNTTPHRLQVYEEGITVCRQPDTFTEEDGSVNTVTHRPVYFPFSSFSGYSIGMKALNLFFPEPGSSGRKGFLYIPYEVLAPGDADRLINLLSAASVGRENASLRP